MDPFRKLAKMKTLLVDDDELIRDALSLAFMNIEKPFLIKKLITSLALLVEKHNAMSYNHG